jgi:hypothetical protein
MNGIAWQTAHVVGGRGIPTGIVQLSVPKRRRRWKPDGGKRMKSRAWLGMGLERVRRRGKDVVRSRVGNMQCA